MKKEKGSTKDYMKYDTKKYRPLENYLRTVSGDSITLLFSDIERIIDAKLPRSAYTYPAWWSNGGHNYAGAWLNAGFKVEEVRFGEFVKFAR